MSTLNLQNQISKLQSQLDSKRAVKEKANSVQRRKSKSPSHKKGPTPRDRKVVAAHVDQKRRVKYNMGGVDNPDHSLDLSAARVAQSKVIFDAKSALQKLQKAHDLARDQKLPVWDHTKRVVDESAAGKVRFQTFKEWKDQQPKPSLLTQAIKCVHDWQVTAFFRDSHCKKCGVAAKDLKDEKTDSALTEALTKMYDMECQEFEVARGMFRSAFKNSQLDITLWSNLTTTGGTTTAINPVINVLAQSSAEFTSLAALFDEFKMYSIETHNRIRQDQGAYGTWIVAWDPMDNTAFGGYLAAMSSFSRTPPLTYRCGGLTSPEAGGSITGFFVHHFKIPSQTQVGSSAGALAPDAPGTWMDCQDSTGVKCGYIKAWADAPNAGIVSLLTIYGMKCHFRCRT